MGCLLFFSYLVESKGKSFRKEIDLLFTQGRAQVCFGQKYVQLLTAPALLREPHDLRPKVSHISATLEANIKILYLDIKEITGH